VRHREVGTYIIWTTLEAVGDSFPGKKADLYKLCSSTLQDPESAEVRVNTMLALRYVYSGPQLSCPCCIPATNAPQPSSYAS
jgi:hypothetical protein